MYKYIKRYSCSYAIKSFDQLSIYTGNAKTP